MPNMTNVDQSILDTIDILREQHNACTARAIASKLRMSPDVVRYRMVALQKAGFVTWTKMPGSVVRIKADQSTQTDPLETPDVAEQSPTPEPPAKTPKPVKKTAKKPTAKTTEVAPTKAT